MPKITTQGKTIDHELQRLVPMIEHGFNHCFVPIAEPFEVDLGVRLPSREEIIAAARSAGVVGAHDGIPAHVKLEDEAEIIIANGSECEPLVYSDRHLMLHRFNEILDGLRLAMKATKAERGIITCSNLSPEIEEHARKLTANAENIEIFVTPGFYPACEELTITYETTGRTIDDFNLPISVGVTVLNVETLHNLSLAAAGKPVTHRTVTIAGEVAHPQVLRMPLGARISDAIDRVGGVRLKEYAIISGGPMSGSLAGDASEPITKNTAAILVLPAQHMLIQKRARSLAMMLLRARSVCLSCTECTDHCTRHLLGQSIKPHEIMRAISDSLENLTSSITSAVNCGECGICDTYVCKMGISPRLVCRQIKAHLKAMGWQPLPPAKRAEIAKNYADAHISPEKLAVRLGIEDYLNSLNLTKVLQQNVEEPIIPLQNLTVPLLQHIGVPAQPTVHVGDAVEPGQLIGEIPEGKVGARVHTGIGGRVDSIGRDIQITDMDATCTE